MASPPAAGGGGAKGIADLLVLQQRLRSCHTHAELALLVVNESRLLLPYDVALIWFERPLEAVSGLAEPVRNATFTRWANELPTLLAGEKEQSAQLLGEENLPAPLNEEWGDYLPPRGLWLPLWPAGSERQAGALLLVRHREWSEGEQRLAGHWASAVAHALQALNWQRAARRRCPSLRRPLLWSFFLLLLASQWLPVPLTALAPAEVVARDPFVVRSALDGVIGEVLVEPNRPVATGTLLFRLDDTSLLSRLEVARQELEIARAERLRAEQAAVTDREASRDLPILAARVEQRQTELDYIRQLLERIGHHAERSGVALMSDAHQLEGKPVRIGERIMTIADPATAELELWLPVGDSLRIATGAAVTLHLNIMPEQPLAAELRTIDHQARLTPDGILAYRVRATFVGEGPLPRIGLRGTGRLEGEIVPLYYYLFRRPLAALRQAVGF